MRSRRFASLGSLLLLLVACGPKEPQPEEQAQRARPMERALGALALHSDPAPAFVFIDGVFVGETAAEASLVVTRPAGEVDLRIAAPGRGDGIYRVEVPAGEKLTLKATLTLDQSRWDRPTRPVPIGPGQDLRGAVLVGSSGPLPVTYEETVAGPVERIVCLVLGNPELVVRDPDGEALPLEAMPEGVQGATGHRFLRVRLDRPGTHRLVVGGPGGGYVLRWMNGLPPLSGSDDPSLAKRRLAPESLAPK